MNKGYNIGIFFISILTLLFAYLMSVKEEFGGFEDLIFLNYARPYTVYIYAVVAGFILLIGGSRAARKWSGIKIVNRVDKFIFNQPISKDRKNLVRVHSLTEILAYILFAWLFYKFSEQALVVTLVFVLLMVNAILNLFMGNRKDKYRIGLTRKAIIQVDREVKPIYFKGLKRISMIQDEVFFEYINDLVLDIQLSTIPEEKRGEFLDLLRKTVDESKVYYSGFKDN